MRQKAVFEKVKKKVAKGQKAVISREMEGIYSKSVAARPHKLTQSKGWQELMDKYLPDSKLVTVHQQLLGKVDQDGQPHSDVNRALDMAYRLKGHYGKDDSEQSNTVNIKNMIVIAHDQRHRENQEPAPVLEG